MILKSEALIELIQKQVVHELSNELLYIQLSSMCKNDGFLNCSKWFKSQSEEESNHAKMCIDFLNEAGVDVEISEIKKQELPERDIQGIFKAALDREKLTTEHLNKIVDLALTEKDFVTMKFAQDLLYIQLAEEDEAMDRYIVAKMHQDPLMLDHYIGDM